jgi:hypothetical protein
MILRPCDVFALERFGITGARVIVLVASTVVAAEPSPSLDTMTLT